MRLQTLRSRDFDELAEAFPRWDLRFRQLGRGPFRGRLQFLQLEGVQVFRLSVNRLIHVEGCPPPGSFGCFPVLDPNEKAVWAGRHLKVGQVRVFDLNQTADHVTAPDQYQLVALVVGGDLLRKEVSLLLTRLAMAAMTGSSSNFGSLLCPNAANACSTMPFVLQ